VLLQRVDEIGVSVYRVKSLEKAMLRVVNLLKIYFLSLHQLVLMHLVDTGTALFSQQTLEFAEDVGQAADDLLVVVL